MASVRAPSICTRCLRALPRRPGDKLPSRAFTSRAGRSVDEGEASATDETPRWHRTPPAMKMPVRLRPRPKGPIWKVNDEQEPLDEMYDKFMGGKVRGRNMLPEEIKWLAVTHKSFDHARRGFNDRLAYLGKRIVDLQASMALLNAPTAALEAPPRDEVYQHTALQGVENVTNATKHTLLDRDRLSRLANTYGVQNVVRWKPKRADNLDASGFDTVVVHTVYSIIGALALQRGGEVAADVVRTRILQPLGLK